VISPARISSSTISPKFRKKGVLPFIGSHLWSLMLVLCPFPQSFSDGGYVWAHVIYIEFSSVLWHDCNLSCSPVVKHIRKKYYVGGWTMLKWILER
jgi:hypothetical protein